MREYIQYRKIKKIQKQEKGEGTGGGGGKAPTTPIEKTVNHGGGRKAGGGVRGGKFVDKLYVQWVKRKREKCA